MAEATNTRTKQLGEHLVALHAFRVDNPRVPPASWPKRNS